LENSRSRHRRRTGINTHIDFARKTIDGIADETGLKLREAKNHFEAQASRDAAVEASGALKTVAVSLIKIANDIRLLGSGPRCGIGELKLPATQPGSSIMPGKVNPVMCEMLIQVGAQVIGNDAVITFGGTFGNFELNVMLPVIAHNLLQAIELLTTAVAFSPGAVSRAWKADVAKCEGNIENSLAMCTALAPVIGYDKAADIAKQAYKSGKTIRQVAPRSFRLGQGKARSTPRCPQPNRTRHRRRRQRGGIKTPKFAVRSYGDLICKVEITCFTPLTPSPTASPSQSFPEMTRCRIMPPVHPSC